MAEFPNLKKPKVNALEVAVGLFTILFTVNWLCAYYGWKPFLYCWISPLIYPAYDAWSGIATVLAALFFFFGLVTRRYKLAATAVGILVVVTGLPQYGAILFRWGGSCG